MPIVSPGPRLILKLAATARAYGEGIGRFFGQVDNSRGSKRGLTRPRQKLRQRHTITPSRSLPSKLIEISPGGTSREQDRTDFGKRFSASVDKLDLLFDPRQFADAFDAATGDSSTVIKESQPG